MMKREDPAIKKLFEVASMREEESPEPAGDFSANVFRRIRLAQENRKDGSPTIGEMAWQMLPVFLVVMVLLCIWNFYENAQVERTRKKVFTTAMQSGELKDSVVLYLFLQDPSTRSGQKE